MDEKPENLEKSDVSGSRRGFIKKAAYTAPALLVMGQLLPKEANAIGPPVSQPGTGNPGGPLRPPRP